ncbi:MAG: hypothetical protein KAY37_00895 [Phycisphaerae bacterium]|nr:hypothetical protein [Phycisphaerae bacterium]
MNTVQRIDTFNRFGVAGRHIDSHSGHGVECMIVLGRPPIGLINKADALLLAAYLVTLADDDEQFQSVLAAVREA